MSRHTTVDADTRSKIAHGGQDPSADEAAQQPPSAAAQGGDGVVSAQVSCLCVASRFKLV